MKTLAYNPHYSLVMITYLTIWVVFLSLKWYLHLPWPELAALDLLVLSLATFRLTEIITEEKVAQTLRAPFCERRRTLQQDGSESEEEVPRGRGLRRVCGELVLCPWCAGVWIATGLCFFYVLMPATARLLVLVFAVAAGGMLFQILIKLMDRTRQNLPVPTGAGVSGPGLASE